MNFRLWLCVGMGVFVVHLSVFMLWTHFQPRPKLRPPGTHAFKARAQAVTDPNTGERYVVREFTVSTQLATPAPAAPAMATEIAENSGPRQPASQSRPAR
jgi:hypothetical protein